MPNSWSSSRLDPLIPRRRRRAALRPGVRAPVGDSPGTPARRVAPAVPTRGLAQELGLSRGTVSAAYAQLVEEGHLATRPGAGTTVAEAPQRAQAPASCPAPAPATPRHDLRPGLPDVSAFPTRAWLAATRRVLNHARPEPSAPETRRAVSNCATPSPTTWAAPAA